MGTQTGSAQVAKFSYSMAFLNLARDGFETEGINLEARQRDPLAKQYRREVQTAMIIAGVPYNIKIPALFKISKKGDIGSLQFRKVGDHARTTGGRN
jgi:hypothetical protein